MKQHKLWYQVLGCIALCICAIVFVGTSISSHMASAQSLSATYRELYHPYTNDGLATSPFTVWDESGESTTGVEEGYFSIPTDNITGSTSYIDAFSPIQIPVNSYTDIPYSTDKTATKYSLYFWYYNADNTTRGLHVKLKVSDSAYLEWNLEPEYLNAQMKKNTEGSAGSVIEPNAWFLIQLPMYQETYEDNTKLSQIGTVYAGGKYLTFTSIEVCEYDTQANIAGTCYTKYFYHFYIDAMQNTSASVVEAKSIRNCKASFGYLQNRVEQGLSVYQGDVYTLPALQPTDGSTPAITYAWWGDKMISTSNLDHWQIRITHPSYEKGSTTIKFKDVQKGVSLELLYTGNYMISYEYVVSGSEKYTMAEFLVKGVEVYYPVKLGTISQNLTVGKTYTFTYKLVDISSENVQVFVKSSNTSVLEIVEVNTATKTITYKAVGGGSANITITPIANVGAENEKVYDAVVISIQAQNVNVGSNNQTYIFIGVMLGIAVVGVIAYGVYMLIKRSKLEVK